MELIFYYKRGEYLSSRFKYVNHLKIIPAYLYIIFALLSLGSIIFMATKIFIAGGIFLALTVALLLFYLSLMVFIPLNQFNKTPELNGEQHFIFDGNDVQIIYDDLQINKNLSDYKALYESKKYFYFIMDTHHYTMVPKRLFDDIEDEKMLRDLYIGETQGEYKAI
ncbi:MAG: YcxB family protein [Clostridia bacterium]|nr:YcxB family protein [Clostridia bacterium]